MSHHLFRGCVVLKRAVFWVFILCLCLLMVGCLPKPTNISVANVKFDWDFIPMVTGRAANTGGNAQYVELAVKLTHPDDPNLIYATGWTNFANFGTGERRSFTMVLTGTPPGEFKYYFRWSTKVGGAMY